VRVRRRRVAVRPGRPPRPRRRQRRRRHQDTVFFPARKEPAGLAYLQKDPLQLPLRLVLLFGDCSGKQERKEKQEGTERAERGREWRIRGRASYEIT
jgi:hypothetical protein